ncbi:MAG: hypothetical protein IPO87_14635 [Flavobacteriales bacterium]|nr:hypothetical protein [Flavobacteriales bacterium]
MPTGIVVGDRYWDRFDHTADAIVRVIDHTILVDRAPVNSNVRATNFIDARGARVGRVNCGNAMNHIPVDVAQGVMVLRVFHKSGAFVQRVFVP